MDQTKRNDTTPPELSVKDSRRLQGAFWHSGLNATTLPRGSDKVVEGPGECLRAFEGSMFDKEPSSKVHQR